MYYFEIRNKKTNEHAEAIANTMQQACTSLGWKAKDCKCVYRAKEEQ